MSQNNLNLIIEKILSRIGKSNIISMGDSHADFFKNLDKISIEWLGPALAYNMNRDVSTNNTKTKILNVLDNSDPSQSAFILSFGETDVRVHVLKRVDIEHISVEESVKRVVKEYTIMIDFIKSLGYKILVHGLHGTGTAYNPQFPYYGTMEERNKATSMFNSYLENYCNVNYIPFVSLFDVLVDKDSYLTNVDYIHDGCHLNIVPELQEIVLSRFLSKIEEIY